MSKGSLYTFEGINGCGKSSVLEEMADALQSEGQKVTKLRNPTGGPIGQEIRRVVHEQRVKGFPLFFSRREETVAFATRLAVLFTADRLQQQEEIRTLLEDGHTVLCDRYALSTIIYQCAMIGDVNVESPLFRAIATMHEGVVRPDTTFVFDVPVDVARARLAARGEQNDDRMMVSIEPAARAMYLDTQSTDRHGESNLAWRICGEVRHIDANRSLRAVVSAALDHIRLAF